MINNHNIGSTSKTISIAEFLERLNVFKTTIGLKYDTLLTDKYYLKKPIDYEKATIVAENRYLTQKGFNVNRYEELQDTLTREHYYYRLKYEITPSRLDYIVNPKKISEYNDIVKQINEIQFKEARREEIPKEKKEAFLEDYNNYKIKYEYKPKISERLWNLDKVENYLELLREQMKLLAAGSKSRDEQQRLAFIETCKRFESKYYKPKDSTPTKGDRYFNPKKFTEYQELKDLSAKIRSLGIARKEILNLGKTTKTRIESIKKAVRAADRPTQEFEKNKRELEKTGETLNKISRAFQCCDGLENNQRIKDLGTLDSVQKLEDYIDLLNYNTREKFNLEEIPSTVTVGELKSAIDERIQGLDKQAKSMEDQLRSNYNSADCDILKEIAKEEHREIREQIKEFSELTKSLGRITNAQKRIRFEGNPADPDVIARQAESIRTQSKKILVNQEKNKSMDRKFDNQGLGR